MGERRAKRRRQGRPLSRPTLLRGKRRRGRKRRWRWRGTGKACGVFWRKQTRWAGMRCRPGRTLVPGFVPSSHRAGRSVCPCCCCSDLPDLLFRVQCWLQPLLESLHCLLLPRRLRQCWQQTHLLACGIATGTLGRASHVEDKTQCCLPSESAAAATVLQQRPSRQRQRLPKPLGERTGRTQRQSASQPRVS